MLRTRATTNNPRYSFIVTPKITDFFHYSLLMKPSVTPSVLAPNSHGTLDYLTGAPAVTRVIDRGDVVALQDTSQVLRLFLVR